MQEPAFALSLAAGRALVVCQGQHHGPLRLARLEMEVPDLRFPLDLADGPNQFRRRWCTVRAADLEASEEDLRRLLRAFPARGLGLLSADLVLRPDHALLFGAVTAGGRRADFTARVALEASGRREVRLSLFDVWLYGPLPVPAPMLGAVLLGTAPEQRRGDASVRVMGPTDLELRPLDEVLEQVLPRAGWRIPDRRDARLVRLELRAGGAALGFARAPGVEVVAGRGTEDARLWREACDRFAEAEQQLVRGDVAGAMATYRADLSRHPADLFLLERMIGLWASSDRIDEAADLCARALGLRADFVPALLGLACLAEDAGRNDEAARRWDEVAEVLERTGVPEEVEAATLAAARAYEPDRPAEAAARLEEVLRRKADHAAALESLDRIYHRIARPAERVRILHRRAALEIQPARAAALRLALGRVYLDDLDDAEPARAELERAVALAPDDVPALCGLAEACARLGDVERAVALLDRAAALALAAGGTATAVQALLRGADLLEASEPDDAIARLRRAVEADPARGDLRVRLAALAARRGRTGDALDNYEAALGYLGDAERAATLAEIARLRVAVGGDPRSAHAAVRRALDAEHPAEREAELLVLALGVAEAQRDHAETAELLGRIAAKSEDPARRGEALMRQGTLLMEVLGREAEAAPVLQQAAWLGADAALDALFCLADRQGRAEDPTALRATLELIVALPDRAAADRARLRLADLARRRGDTAEARALLELAARGPTEIPALRALGPVLRATGASAAEDAALERLLRLMPDEVAAMARRADLCLELGRLDDARQQVEALLRRSPESERAALLFRLGEIAEKMGEARQAFGRYREALSAGLSGESARTTYQHLHRMALDRQDWDLAARLLRSEADEASLGLGDGERAELLIAAAVLWRDRLDRPQEAEACLRRALDLRADHEPALLALESLFRARSDLVRVAEIVERRAQAAAGGPEEIALVIELGVLRATLGQADAARYAYLRALAIDPECRPALLALGRAARERGDAADAETHLGRLAALDGRHAEVLEARRLLAAAARDAGRPEEEAARLSAVLEIAEDPAERFRVASRIAALRAGTGDRAEALLAYRRALEVDPDHAPTLWATARLLGEEGQTREQAASLERLLVLPPAPSVPEPDGLRALLRDLYRSVPEAALADPARAALLAEERRIEELAGLYAEEAARRGSVGPAPAALAMQAARLYQGPLDRPEAAAEAWLRAARADEAGAQAPALRAADLFAQAGEPERAAEALGVALAAAAEDEQPALLLRRAEAYLGAGRTDEAIADLRGAIALDPEAFDARARLGEVLIEAGDRTGAVAHLAAAAEGLDDDGHAARCAVHAAEALEALGRPEEALLQWELAHTRAPDERAPLVALLHAAEAASAHARAAELAALAAAREPDAAARARLLLARARALEALDLGDEAYAAARAAFRADGSLEAARALVRGHAEAREDWSELAGVLRHEADLPGEAAERAPTLVALGRALEALGDAEQAAFAYARAAEADAGHRAAHQALVRLHVAAGRVSDAARAAEALVGLAADAHEEGRLAFEAGGLRIRAGEHDAARLLLAYAAERPGPAGDKALLALARLADDAAKRRQVRDLARARLGAEPDEATRAALVNRLADQFAKLAGHEEAAVLARELSVGGGPLEELAVDALEADGAEAQMARGARAEAEGQDLIARAAYALALQQDPDHVGALDALADLAFRAGDHALAAALYVRLAGRGSRVAPDELACRLGAIAEARDETGAVEHYRDALQENPSCAPALEALARLEEGAAAIERLRALLGTLPEDDVAQAVEVKQRIADLERQRGNVADARAGYLDVLRQDPHRASALEPLFAIEERLVRWGDAAAALERLVPLTPDPALRSARLSRLADICREHLSDVGRAIDALLRAADLAPDPGPVLLRLVDCYWESGDLEGVAGMAAEVARVAGDPGPARAARLGIALAVRGRSTEARQHLAGSAPEAVAAELCDAAGKGIDVEPALKDIAPTAGDRHVLADAVRAAGGPGFEIVLALLV
jgi:tetratricopeptide (TPR) repeat protein